jgi:hypothetical protein
MKNAHRDAGFSGTSKRKIYINRVVCYLLVYSVFLLAGCGPSMGPRISIKWRSPKLDVKNNTPLVYMSLTIGKVNKVESGDNGFIVQADLYKKYAHYVRESSTFLVRKGAESQKTVIEVRPTIKDAPAAMDGAVFSGSDSELEAGVRALVTDWKRTAVLAAVAIAVILLLLFLTKLFFKFWALVVCVISGAAAARYLSPFIDQRLHGLLPANVRSDLIAYAVAFLAGFIIANIVVGILFRPLRSKR